ncbi:MAG: hypothetical protein ACRYGR_10735 [Janthinobacterium lividum]
MIKRFVIFLSFLILQNAGMASHQNEVETICKDITYMALKNVECFKLEQLDENFRDLPNEIKNKIVINSSSNNNSLLKLREISKEVAEIVDQLFYQQSEIKLPLSCLKERSEKYPYTISYFLRKALWNIPKYGWKTCHEKKELQIRKFERMTTLSNAVGYVGKEAFSITSDPKFYVSQGKMTNFNWDIDNVEATTTDIKEAQIFYSSFMINTNTGPMNYKQFQFLLTPFIEHIFQAAESMSDDEKKNITCYYIKLIGHHFLELKDPENAKPFLDFIEKYDSIFVQSSS